MSYGRQVVTDLEKLGFERGTRQTLVLLAERQSELKQEMAQLANALYQAVKLMRESNKAYEGIASELETLKRAQQGE